MPGEGWASRRHPTFTFHLRRACSNGRGAAPAHSNKTIRHGRRQGDRTGQARRARPADDGGGRSRERGDPGRRRNVSKLEQPAFEPVRQSSYAQLPPQRVLVRR